MQSDKPYTPIDLPEPDSHPELLSEISDSEVQPKISAEVSEPTVPSAALPNQDTSSVPAQTVEVTNDTDDERQFSWSYVRMGALGVRRYDITATLTAETLQVKEQKRFGWKPMSNETDIALTDIQQVHIRSKASFLYWGLFAALVALGVIAFVVGILNSTACVLLALFVAIYAWLGSFQLLHNEIVIADHSGKEIVLKGGKRELFQQLERELDNRAGIGPKEFQSAAGVIVLSIIAGTAVIIGFLLLAWGGQFTPAHEIEKELIGEWGIEYAEDNGTVVYSYDLFLAHGYTDEEVKLLLSNTYIQISDDHSFELVLCDETGYSESIYGTWKANGINGKNVTLKSSDEEVNGYLDGGCLYLEGDTFFIKTSKYFLIKIRNSINNEEISNQPSSLLPPQEGPKELIGCWQLKQVKYSAGTVVTYPNNTDEFLRIYSDGIFSYMRQNPFDEIGLNGHWSAQDDAIIFQNADGSAIRCRSDQIIHLESGMLYLNTNEKEFMFEKISDQPAYTAISATPIPTTDIYGDVSSSGDPGWMDDPYYADEDDPYWIKNLKDYLRAGPAEMVGPAYTRLMEENSEGWNRLVTEYIDTNNLGIYTDAAWVGMQAASDQAKFENPHCETNFATVFFGWYDAVTDMIEIDIIWNISIPYYDPAFSSTPVQGYYYAHALVDNIGNPEYSTVELTEAYFYNLTGV